MKFIALMGLPCLVALAACSPRYDWREARLDAGELTALLPCKPDHATRPVAFGAGRLDVHMMGCAVGQTTFTVAGVQLREPSLLTPTLALWQASTRLQLQGAAPGAQQPGPVQPAFSLAGATPVPGSGRWQLQGTQGQGSDARTLTVQAAWFASGTWLYQAAIYMQGPAPGQSGQRRSTADPEEAENFFTGLRLP